MICPKALVYNSFYIYTDAMKQEQLIPMTMIAVGWEQKKKKRKLGLFRVQTEQRNRPRIIQAYAYKHARNVANKMRWAKCTETRWLSIEKIHGI